MRLTILGGEHDGMASHHMSRAAPRSAAHRILVVDDDKDSAELLAMLLGFSGHDVRLAHDGLRAIDMTSTFRPDVVLLDIGLPKVNGYEAAQQIRSQPGATPLLVALTGRGHEEDRRTSTAAGFDLHLVKPVDHDLLIGLIDSLSTQTVDGSNWDISRCVEAGQWHSGVLPAH